MRKEREAKEFSATWKASGHVTRVRPISSTQETAVDSANAMVKPAVAGVIYGEIARWVIFAGVIIAIIGSGMYFASGGYLTKETLITNLWQSIDAPTLWQTCTGNNASSFEARWYLTSLPQGDAIAMLGIAIACLAGVFGMWGAFVSTVRGKKGIYIIFALITSVILSLSALGVLKM